MKYISLDLRRKIWAGDEFSYITTLFLGTISSYRACSSHVIMEIIWRPSQASVTLWLQALYSFFPCVQMAHEIVHFLKTCPPTGSCSLGREPPSPLGPGWVPHGRGPDPGLPLPKAGHPERLARETCFRVGVTALLLHLHSPSLRMLSPLLCPPEPCSAWTRSSASTRSRAWRSMYATSWSTRTSPSAQGQPSLL